MAPAAGFEPATRWLTATYSTAELCRSVSMFLNIVRFEEKGKLEIEKIWTFFLKNAIFQASGNSSCGNFLLPAMRFPFSERTGRFASRLQVRAA